MHLPEEFKKQMCQTIGEEEFSKLHEALNAEAPTSIRTNPSKPSTNSPQGVSVPWCEEGIYLSQRPAFTFDPLFHAGTYYVQEASSMFVSHILKTHVNKPSVTLDLCAAPGGKSTLALSTLPTGSLLIANEIVRQRSQILAENLIKWGNPNVIVTNNCAADFQPMGEVFDVIICDAPCSGEGMFRKDPQSIDEWSPANVVMCQNRQREILSDIWPCLKPGGILIYSTCTYNTLENEENAQWAVENLNAELLATSVPPSWGITGNLLNGTTDNAHHFFPHKTVGEGFFACALRKNESESESYKSSNSKKGNSKQNKGKELPVPKELKSWVSSPDRFTFSTIGNTHTAFPSTHSCILSSALATLKVIHYGITLATVKGKAIIPHHSLAMSTSLSRPAFPMAELTEQQAIAYLRTESITLQPEVPHGFVIVCYQSIPLGFVKNIGSRANNLYPAEWRIRKSL